MKAVRGEVVSRTKQDRCRHDDADDGNIWTLALPNTSTLPERAQQSVSIHTIITSGQVKESLFKKYAQYCTINSVN